MTPLQSIVCEFPPGGKAFLQADFFLNGEDTKNKSYVNSENPDEISPTARHSGIANAPVPKKYRPSSWLAPVENSETITVLLGKRSATKVTRACALSVHPVNDCPTMLLSPAISVHMICVRYTF